MAERYFAAILLLALLPFSLAKGWTEYSFLDPSWGRISRGGAQRKAVGQDDAFTILARAVQNQIDEEDSPEISDLVKAFKTLSASQKTFKGLDGAAHEAYQRTHNSDNVKMEVSGRASRTTARTSAVACALEACELSELVMRPDIALQNHSSNGTLANREVLLNDTLAVGSDLSLRCLVLLEPDYHGNAGVGHGDIQEIITTVENRRIQGRILIVIGITEQLDNELLDMLAQSPTHVKLEQDQVTDEAASVQPTLHRASSLLLERVDPILRQHSRTAIHLVGHSLAGGVACIAAAILDGRVPLKNAAKKAKSKKKRKGTAAKEKAQRVSNATQLTNQTLIPLQGLGRMRTSAVALGAPPCLSSNVQTDFIISIMHGDDIVGRTSSESLHRFYKRTRKALKNTGFFGGQINKIGDTISLATSNLKNYAHGSEGEEARLAIPGRAYLIRPRRLGGTCSIHEIGSQLKGGREAIRASVLWQLNDVLLSKSLWKHHKLEAYIHGLDRVHIRGIDNSEDEEAMD